MVATIEGTATYQKVILSPHIDDQIEVAGFYEDSTTTYLAPEVKVDGLKVEVEGEVTLTYDSWIWVQAEEDTLTITSEEPDDVDS